MGKLVVLAEKSIEGPWLIGHEELEQLDELIKSIAVKLEDAHKKKRETYLQKLSAPVKVKVVLTSKENTKLEDTSIKGILKDIKVKNFPPVELYVKVENVPGENEFVISITSGYEGKLEYKLNCFDENEEQEIMYELDKWVNKFKPKKIVTYWLNAFELIAIIGGLTVFIMFFSLYDTTNDYDVELNKQAIKLISKGIDQTNMHEAVDILLKKQVKYTPKEFKIVETLNLDNLRNFIRVALIYIILLLCPRSIIGIGKKDWQASLYKRWLKVVLVLIPGSMLLPKVLDIINNYLF